MARNIEGSDVDPAIASALAAPPRAAKSLRETEQRAIPKRDRNKFYVPPEMIPKGYVVEWKRKSYFGKPEEADYFMDLEEAGWKNAPIEPFRRLMPSDYEGKTVERGGMILMMRPAKMKEDAIKLGKQEALGQVRDKLVEIGMTGQGELPRKVQSFSRQYEGGAGTPVPGNDDDGTEE